MMQIRQIPLSQLTYLPSIGHGSPDTNDFIENLAADIKERGIKRPLIVRAVGDMFQVVAGLRRWKAAIIADLASVPADVRQLTDEEAYELAMMDNMAPVDMSYDLQPEPVDGEPDEDFSEFIAETARKIAEQTIDQTPTFAINEPLPPEFCELFKSDFEKAEIIEQCLKAMPKADPSLCEQDFDRFTAGLEDGRLHLEGHLYAVNSYLLIYIEAYLTPEDLGGVFSSEQWAEISDERRTALNEYARAVHPAIAKLLGMGD